MAGKDNEWREREKGGMGDIDKNVIVKKKIEK